MSAEQRDGERHGIPAPTYRLPADTTVGPVRLLVSDLGEPDSDVVLCSHGDVIGSLVGEDRS